MTTEQVAKRFYALGQEGNWDKILEELYSPEAKSVEPAQAQGLQSANGLDEIKAKAKKWAEMIEETHGGYCLEPQVAANHFTCVMGIDVTMKGQGRMKMDEVAVYEVKDGKIVTEQFFF